MGTVGARFVNCSVRVPVVSTFSLTSEFPFFRVLFGFEALRKPFAEESPTIVRPAARVDAEVVLIGSVAARDGGTRARSAPLADPLSVIAIGFGVPPADARGGALVDVELGLERLEAVTHDRGHQLSFQASDKTDSLNAWGQLTT